MPFCYSPSRRGFFSVDIHGDMMPTDCVTLSDAEYRELLSRLASGHTVEMRNGRPIAVRPAAPQDQPHTLVPALDFRRSFTPAEKARITLEASRGLEQGDATLQVFLDDVNSAQTVNLRSEEVTGGVAYLVSKGLLTPRRADEILRR